MNQTATAHENAAKTDAMPARMARRVALFTGSWITLSWALVAVFLAPAIPGGWWTMAALLVFFLLPIRVLVRGFIERAYPGAWTRVLVLRPFLYVFLMLPLVAIVGLVGALVGLAFGGAMRGGLVAVVGAAGFLALFSLAGYVGSKWLVVRRVEIRHAHLPAAFDGLRIAQLSDLHVGPHTSARFLAKIAAEVERANPDLIAHTGDQVDDFHQDVTHFVRAFGHLRAPLGVYAIAGNHDIYAGWRGVHEGMQAAGIRVLVNDGVTHVRGDDALHVAGTGDPAASQWGVLDPTAPAPNLEATMAGVPSGAYSLVLAHNPALWRGLRERGAHLTLSGHTHHGQVSIPFLKWSLASPFLEHAMGRYDHGASTLYINPGTNYWGLPLRIGAWPEVTIVTLRRADQRQAEPTGHAHA